MVARPAAPVRPRLVPAGPPWTPPARLHVLSVEWCADGARIAFVGNAPGDRYSATRKLGLWTVADTGGDPECRTASVRAGVGTSPMTER